VDGPHHFTANTQAPLGETAGRRRLLAARGWTVVSIPYFLWDASPSQLAKHAYLAKVRHFCRSRHLRGNFLQAVWFGLLVCAFNTTAMHSG